MKRMMWMSGVLLLMSTSAFAAERDGVKMPDEITVAGKKLQLNGLGVREATIFNVNVYIAGLYVEKKSNQAKAIISPDTVKRIHMQFVRDVSVDQMTEAFTDGFKTNAKDGFGKVEPRLKTMLGKMQAVKDGATMTFTYEPGKGTSLSYGGTTAVTVPGKDFADVLWRIYLGPDAPNSLLREGMLGNE